MAGKGVLPNELVVRINSFTWVGKGRGAGAILTRFCNIFVNENTNFAISQMSSFVNLAFQVLESLENSVVNNPIPRVAIQNVEDGGDVLSSIRECFRLFEQESPLSYDQKMICEKVLCASSRFIFSEDVLDREPENVFKACGWEWTGCVPLGCFVSGPRRMGKTFLFTRIAAVMLLCVPGIVILAIAAEPGPTEALKEAITQATKDLIVLSGRGKIVRSCKEHLVVEVGGDLRKLHAFSARKGDG